MAHAVLAALWALLTLLALLALALALALRRRRPWPRAAGGALRTMVVLGSGASAGCATRRAARCSR